MLFCQMSVPDATRMPVALAGGERGGKPMADETRIPETVSVYEALRTRPGAMARLTRVGLTRDHLDYRLSDAAQELGVSVERFTELLEQDEREPVVTG